MRKCFIFPLICGILFFACAGSPSSTGSSAGIISVKQQSRPEWIDSPYTKYSEQRYVARIGSGASMDEAEKNAFANLTAYFGQSIRDEQKISNIYMEAVKNGVTAEWTETINIDRVIIILISLHFIISIYLLNIALFGKLILLV